MSHLVHSLSLSLQLTLAHLAMSNHARVSYQQFNGSIGFLIGYCQSEKKEKGSVSGFINRPGRDERSVRGNVFDWRFGSAQEKLLVFILHDPNVFKRRAAVAAPLNLQIIDAHRRSLPHILFSALLAEVLLLQQFHIICLNEYTMNTLPKVVF